MGPCLRRSGGPTDLQHRSSIWRCGGKDIVSGNRSANALEFKLPNRLDGYGVQEVEEYARRCSVPDPLDENAWPSALAPETLRLRRYYILTAANAACAKGIDASQLTALSKLVEVENFRVIVRQQWEGCGRKMTPFLADLASTLIVIASEWVKVPADQLAALKKLRSKLKKRLTHMRHGHPRTKSRFGTPPQRPVPTPVAYGLGRRDALQFSLQSSSTTISASSSSSSHPGSKSPSAAARSRRRPALPWETPRVVFTSLTVIPREKSSAACWKIGREGILPNGLRPYLKRHHMQAGVGHYGVFSGKRWETQVYPIVKNMILSSD